MSHVRYYKHMAKKSPPDSSDLYLEHIHSNRAHLAKATVLPDEVDLRPFIKAPRSQGNRGTCAAFSSCVIKEYQENKDLNNSIYMSPEFIYYHRGDKSGDNGMYGREVMRILQTIGAVPETSLPYNPIEKPLQQADISKLYKISKNFRIKTFAQITTVDSLKRALFETGPCWICFPVYDNNRNEFWRKIGDSEEVGGHAVCVVGYTKDGFIIRNSWGDYWNPAGANGIKNGYILYPYTDFGAHWEIWTGVDLFPEDINILKEEHVVTSFDYEPKCSFGKCVLL